MPYEILDDAIGCDGFAVVKEGESTPVPGGCHATFDEAQQHLIALEIATEDEDERALELRQFAPNDAMQVEAQRGLDWRAEFGRGGTEVGVARARDIVNGRNLSLDTVRRMVSYFARHEVDKQGQGWSPDEDGYPSAGRIAWALWGGDPGRSWANRIVSEETERSQKMEQNETPVRYDVLSVERRKIGGREVEFRTVEVGALELRYSDDREMPMRFAGYAAVFNSPSEPLPFVETIAPGAFRRSLNAGREVRMFLNHNTDQVLASTKSGSLSLREDERGLYVEADLPDTTYGRDLSVLMQRGDVHSMSFGFSVPRGGDSWNDNGSSRELREVILHEVSVVTGFPAYPATEGAMIRTADTDDVVDTERGLPLGLAQRMFELNAKRV